MCVCVYIYMLMCLCSKARSVEKPWFNFDLRANGSTAMMGRLPTLLCRLSSVVRPPCLKSINYQFISVAPNRRVPSSCHCSLFVASFL